MIYAEHDFSMFQWSEGMKPERGRSKSRKHERAQQRQFEAAQKREQRGRQGSVVKTITTPSMEVEIVASADFANGHDPGLPAVREDDNWI